MNTYHHLSGTLLLILSLFSTSAYSGNSSGHRSGNDAYLNAESLQHRQTAALHTKRKPSQKYAEHSTAKKNTHSGFKKDTHNYAKHDKHSPHKRYHHGKRQLTPRYEKPARYDGTRRGHIVVPPNRAYGYGYGYGQKSHHGNKNYGNQYPAQQHYNKGYADGYTDAHRKQQSQQRPRRCLGSCP